MLTGLRRDVPELMAAMDLFVLSSLWKACHACCRRRWQRDCPLWYSGRRFGRSSERRHQRLPFTPARPDLLAARLDQLLQDAQLRPGLVCAGLERAPEFGAARMVAAIDALYCELLAT